MLNADASRQSTERRRCAVYQLLHHVRRLPLSLSTKNGPSPVSTHPSDVATGVFATTTPHYRAPSRRRVRSQKCRENLLAEEDDRRRRKLKSATSITLRRLYLASDGGRGCGLTHYWAIQRPKFLSILLWRHLLSF